MALPRVNILGVAVTAASFEGAVDQLEKWIENRSLFYLTVCTTNTTLECRRSTHLRSLVNQAAMVTSDGMPLVWISRLRGHSKTERVYGPDLLLELCRRGQRHGWRHFFYGGGPGVASGLARALVLRFPEMLVAGACSPGFRGVDEEEDTETIRQINDTQPDIIWVGLGTPKQDFWVAKHRRVLTAPALIPVGAAFDFHSGRLRQAPRWMQRNGLEWLFRLSQEPVRLAPRYLHDIPVFALLASLQLLGLYRPPLPEPPLQTQQGSRLP